MKTIILKIFLVVIVIGPSSMAQQLTPPIQNYTSLQYAAASQNWDVAVDSLGIVYAANNDGLLIYDGQQWELNKLRSGSILRSVLPYKGKVYTGSYKEFGYWLRDYTGVLNYTSLMPLMNNHQMQNEEIWDIVPYDGSLFFRSFGGIYEYNGKSIIVVDDILTNAMIVFKDQLFISAGPRGVYKLNKDRTFVPIDNQKILNDRVVIDFEVDGEQLLFGTSKGLYTYKNGKVQPFNERELNKQLGDFDLNHLLKISDNEFAFATVKNGVVYYNRKTGDIRIYNRNSGLQNNTILSMTLHKGKLWLGMDNGIDLIDLESPVNFYTDDSGEIGAVYDLTYYNSNLYLASNTGVYLIKEDGPVLLNGAEGHSWNLEVINGILYSNHNKGTFKIIGEDLIPVEQRTGSYTIVQPAGRSNELLISNYTGISVYRPLLGEVERLNGVNFPIKKMVFENPEILWAAHPYEGLYRIGISNDSARTSFIEKIGDLQGKGNYKADVFKVNNQIAVLQDNIWYKYNSLVDSLSVFEELKNYNYHRLLLEDKSGFWFTNTTSNSIVFTDFKERKLNLAFKELNQRLVKGNENLVKINDSIYYITLNDGFGTINLNELLKGREEENLSSPIIYSLRDTEGRYNLAKIPAIPFNQARDVQVRVALPDSDDMELRYELDGKNGNSGKIFAGNLTFQNLSYGDYKLHLYALSPQGKRSEVTTLNFEVLPPWYLSGIMKVVYLLLIFGIIGLIFWYNRRKLKKHQEKLEQKFKEEHEERLRRLEKERLVHEINSKRMELANSTMIGAKKNEVLMEIQGELNKDKGKFSNQFRLKHIMNKINHAIKSKDEWKLFETNFNELHEDFSKELLKKYPTLSSKDLKLCSYLKMNLSSKEIAPLMGISVRGVEVHRYRLRKKMKLNSKENLTNFLIKNF